MFYFQNGNYLKAKSVVSKFYHTDQWYIEKTGMDWVIKNPRDKDHLLAWRSIEAGIRGNRWTHVFNNFLHSPNL